VLRIIDEESLMLLSVVQVNEIIKFNRFDVDVK
jgi:hypothetical protein